MTPTSDLFFLIQSLTKNEKGYFKKFVHTHQNKDSKYILLFNEIEKMDEYDEQKLKLTIKSYSFNIQLAKYKNYLYQLILKSLRSFYSSSNIDRILLDGLNDINLLYEKGLIKQAKKLLKTLKAKAILNQKTTYLYHFYSLEISLNQELHQHQHISNDTILQSYNELNKVHITTITLKLILNDLYILTLKKGIEKDNATINTIKTKLDLLKKKDGKYFSFSTQLDFLYAYGIIYRALDKHTESIKSCIEATKLIENNTNLLKVYIKNYTYMINGLLLSYRVLGDFDSITKWTKKLELVLKQKKINISLNLLLKTRLNILNNNLQNYITKGEFILGRKYFEKELELKHIYVDDKRFLNIYGQAFIIYFGNEKYTQALHWLEKVLYNTFAKSRDDIAIAANLSHLIVNFELENFRLLESYLLSSYRLIHKKKQLHPLEKLIFSFIKKMLNTPKYEQEIYFKKLLLKIEELSTNEYVIRLSMYFDFISWLESKIQKKTYREIIQDKAANTKKP